MQRVIYSLLLILVSMRALAGFVPTYDNSRVVHNNTGTDSTFIFVYYSTNTNQKLKVTSDINTRFDWFLFSKTTETVASSPHQTDFGFSSEIGANEGGYLLVIDDGSQIDSLHIWIFYDLITIDTVEYNSSCEVLQMTAKVSTTMENYNYYDYYDFTDKNSVKQRFIKNDFKMHWDSDVDVYEGVEGMSDGWKETQKSLSTQLKESAPLKDASYTVYMETVFGYKTNIYTTDKIPAKAAYAKFKIIEDSQENSSFEALARIKFENKSINADQFAWVGINDQLINFKQKDTIWKSDLKNLTDEFDYTPGEYPVILSIKNTITGCLASYSDTIIVEPSSFDPKSLPNVFTPNGDGSNDFFVFIKGKEPISMMNIDIRIFSVNGNKVYEYAGDKNTWVGWNGKYMGDRSDCSPGVYYYIIKGFGWDRKSYSGKPYTGTLHLFRGKK